MFNSIDNIYTTVWWKTNSSALQGVCVSGANHSSAVCTYDRPAIMSEKQLSFHLSWVFALLLPCASAQSDDLALNSKLVDTVAGKLLISLIVLSLITIAMAIVLCTLCRIYCFNVIGM